MTWSLVYIIDLKLIIEFIFLGVLGLCAIVLSSPYDISNYVPAALILLCEHLHDPDLIQKSVKKSFIRISSYSSSTSRKIYE
ncbi:unnamed protein product [Rotaria sordida]|uniref:Proteasome activator complex subunit 4 C-terminal domain-containing protein n=1 Tax=Rotaria sordida TaxID=392033 RepID=A0A815MLJ2_9BILA|nr:unnamed protein product [Rotaria sordida]